MAKVHARELIASSTSRGEAAASEYLDERRISATHAITAFSWKQGLVILAFFLGILIDVLILRSLLHDLLFHCHSIVTSSSP